eukprot:scaffold384343_cov27-Prasinocladus_malaysianus.AAC.1
MQRIAQAPIRQATDMGPRYSARAANVRRRLAELTAAGAVVSSSSPSSSAQTPDRLRVASPAGPR